MNIPASLLGDWEHLTYDEFRALKEGERVYVWIPSDDAIREGTFKSGHIAPGIVSFSGGKTAYAFYYGLGEPAVQHSALWQRFLKLKRVKQT
jgi:hypothetical protein